MPEDKQIQVLLQRFRAAKGAMIVQKSLEQTVDVFDHAAGTAGGVEQGLQRPD